MDILSSGERFTTFQLKGQQDVFLEVSLLKDSPSEYNILWHSEENAVMLPYNSEYTLVDDQKRTNTLSLFFEQDGMLDLQIVNCGGSTLNRITH